MNTRPKAVVLLSGGLDSATVLAIAKSRGFDCYTVGIDYGQKHKSELLAASRVASFLGINNHKVIQIDLRSIGGSALTSDEIEVPTDGVCDKGIPVTYVPARNTIFLSIAMGYGENLGARHVFIGANAIDYSGYPDCRPAFIEQFQRLANVATAAVEEGSQWLIDAPLMTMSKSEIVALGMRLGVDYQITVSCYMADGTGAACGSCDACRIRRKGFIDAGLEDPTIYQKGVTANI